MLSDKRDNRNCIPVFNCQNQAVLVCLRGEFEWNCNMLLIENLIVIKRLHRS